MPSKAVRPRTAKAPTQRQLRVGEALRHAVSEVLMREDFFDPDLSNISITISEILVSSDLANARVYTMPLGGVNIEVVLPALNRLAPVIQSFVAKKVHLRRTPRMRFFLDESFENAEKMNKLFAAIRQGP
ncbi:30S ribosome-binding factor RbfA [Candidatus Puniceispirillum sp.]|nr:30S ribosome-binding factor RbfA [Candidatus Puniceispirillum sp.]